MGAVDQNAAFFASGRLSFGATALGTIDTWPHTGGTGLGLVGSIYIIPQRRWRGLVQEETGSASEVQWLGGDVVVGFTARQWDQDAKRFIFPNTTTVSSERVIEWPGSTIPPGAAVPTFTNLVFTPRNPEHPGIIIYKAAPVPDLNAELYFSAYKHLEIPAVVVAIPDGSDRLGKMAAWSALMGTIT